MTKIKNKPAYKVGKIRSIDDLKLERAKLEFEILKTEDEIKGNYHEIIDAFTFRNLFHTISNDINTSKNVISKVYEVGKNVFGRKKKKKKNQPAEPETQPAPTASQNEPDANPGESREE